MFSGATANALANPTDVLKIRMQSNQKQFANKSMIGSFSEIFKSEGLSGLYRVGVCIYDHFWNWFKIELT